MLCPDSEREIREMGTASNQLMLLKCETCGKLFIPPRYVCAECGGNQFVETVSSGEGEILTYTTIRVPPAGFEDQAPYDICVIRLSEGINVTARIVAQEGGKGPEIGDRVSFLRNEEGANWFGLTP